MRFLLICTLLLPLFKSYPCTQELEYYKEKYNGGYSDDDHPHDENGNDIYDSSGNKVYYK